MSQLNQFNRRLNELWKTRTARLRREIGDVGRGKVPLWTARKAKEEINKLESLAEGIIIKNQGKKQFKSVAEKKKSWHVTTSKGWGQDKKKKSFGRWYDRCVKSQNCIYVFWKGKHCLYIGRTEGGKGRPQAQFDSRKTFGTTRIDVYPLAKRSLVHKAECLAIHLFKPKKNSGKSAKISHYQKCPICFTSKKYVMNSRKYFNFLLQARGGLAIQHL